LGPDATAATGFSPTHVITPNGFIWYTDPLTGSFNNGFYSLNLWTNHPGGFSPVFAQLGTSQADGSGFSPIAVSSTIDVNTTGTGNHVTTLAIHVLAPLTLTNQRLIAKVFLQSGSGTTAPTMVYNGGLDFDTNLQTTGGCAVPTVTPPVTFHLVSTAEAGVTPAGDHMRRTNTSATGFFPTLTLNATPRFWYTEPVNATLPATSGTFTLWTNSPGASSVVNVRVERTDESGSNVLTLAQASADVNASGTGNHTTRFSLALPAVSLSSQRLRVRLVRTSGANPVVVFNGGSDFDTRLEIALSVSTFTVDRGTDGTDGQCLANQSSRGQCNLRAAVAAALGAGGPVTISLSVDSQIANGEIALAPPAAGRAPAITIEGSNKKVTGSNNSRLFNVSANIDLTLKNFTITAFTAFEGGAIFNGGNLTLSGVTVANNTVSCFGLGATTAFAFCDAGALVNQGRLALGGGTRFDANKVTASALTAAFTNATAGGGAIANSGTLVIDGPVSFTGNVSDATATSGIHPGPAGASASSSGGAISNTGTLQVTGGAIGHCDFSGNVASASASAPPSNTGTATSTGGAIASFGGSITIPPNACTFQNNQAAVDPNVHIE
jgi:hypothetical protein